ncbi:MAG TPA: LysR family transcriptional regulator [Jatrophihabitantaceae bacterium]|jgi:DNA-binding transcriptional LysR family regulator
MELRHITSFLVLAEELHFGRAAARLHMAQPSLSQQLQQLERRIGVQLVARTSHSVRLTPAGEAFRREARRLLGQLDLAVEAARWANSGGSGQVRVGFNYPAGQRILAPTLSLLHDRHPEVRTSLVPKHTRGQLAALRDGQIDIAFIYGALDEKGLCQRSILTLPVVGICSTRHPLAAGAQVRWPELATHRCVLPSQATSPAMYDALIAGARLNGVDLSTAEVFDDGDAAVVMVASEPIVIFASAARAESVQATGLATLSLIDPVPQVTVHAIWRDQDPNPAVPLFLDLLDEAGPEYVSTGR